MPMRTAPALLAACLVLPAGLALPAWADDVAPVAIPVDPATIDIAGQWTYATSNHAVSGMCPLGTPMAGTLSIAVVDGAITVVVDSGATCSPASMCVYEGRIEQGAVVVSNTAVVDDEGGSASNAMQLFFTSPTAGAGRVASGYVHPEGFECQWTHDIALSR
ncbi:MAG: hypothetical protein R3F55_03395 [Alphaproteobacteria bacterium]